MTKPKKKTKTKALVVHKNATPEMLIMEGIKKGISVDTLERLLVIRREVRDEKAREAFNIAMSSFQAECPIIKKNKKVFNKQEKGGSLRYSYATLDSIVNQIRQLLKQYHFSYTIDAIVEKEMVGATCKVTHELGHSEVSTFKVPIHSDAYMSQPQAFASSLTFSKRYAFCDAFGILTSDEDNNAEETPKEAPPEKEMTKEEKFSQARRMILACKTDTVLMDAETNFEKSKLYSKSQKEELRLLIQGRIDAINSK